MLEKELEIINKLGLHARAAAKLVNLASQFESEILISRAQQEINGKSIMGVMMLAASKGVTIHISINGPDESDAMQSIENLIANKFDEGE